jgi:hypothetical protein
MLLSAEQATKHCSPALTQLSRLTSVKAVQPAKADSPTEVAFSNVTLARFVQAPRMLSAIDVAAVFVNSVIDSSIICPIISSSVKS